jgi:hypothetical protein
VCARSEHLTAALPCLHGCSSPVLRLRLQQAYMRALAAWRGAATHAIAARAMTWRASLHVRSTSSASRRCLRGAKGWRADLMLRRMAKRAGEGVQGTRVHAMHWCAAVLGGVLR